MDSPVSVTVELGDRSYEIRAGSGLLAAAGEQLAPLLRHKSTIIVTDTTVAKLYLEPLEASLNDAGIATQAIVIDPGEQAKEFPSLQRLIEDILDAGVERQTTLIALGGGVVGDLTGFAASILLRGIDFVQIPTTLLSQVDSSVGGKTGINTRHGKNLVGAFYQPRMVIADIDTLDTLPQREFLAGYAEIVKYGLINDPGFFHWLEEHADTMCKGDHAQRLEAVVTCCKAKAAIVSADERETGPRALLNLGHTFGHALEAETGFGAKLLHGEAVAIGIGLAFALSVQLGLCPAADAGRVHGHLRALGLPTLETVMGANEWNAQRLIERMHHDKKMQDGKVTFVLVRGIGQAFISHDVDLKSVEDLLETAWVA